ncbi:MAG: VOC family protein [Acidimicrobiales bacterium]
MTAKWTELIVDAADPEGLARFWADVLGWPRTGNYVDDDDGAVELASPDGARPTLVFLRVPETKSVKNRLHIDVSPSGGADQAAELERLLALGARPVDVGRGEQTWVVLADPEGNEFCLLRTPVA